MFYQRNLLNIEVIFFKNPALKAETNIVELKKGYVSKSSDPAGNILILA